MLAKLKELKVISAKLELIIEDRDHWNKAVQAY